MLPLHHRYQPRYMLQENLDEFEIFEEVFSLDWMACEPPTRDLDTLLEELHTLKGSAFVTQLKYIVSHKAFTPISGEIGIYSVGGERDADFENLLNAARKAVGHGYRVFILPNPKGIRTADFIFEKKGNYKMYDLKTIVGKSSAGNRLLESIGQSNRVLLNIIANYNARVLASDIKTYFEVNDDAIEVLIIKGNKIIPINKASVENSNFNRIFRKRYEK